MASAVKDHIEGLQSPIAERRLAAAEALCALGASAAPATLELIDALADSDERVREAAGGALEAIEAPLGAFVSDLAQRLTAANSHQSFWAATMLGRLGVEASPAIESLARVVADAAAPLAVRQKSAWALGQIGASAQSALPQLQQAAASDDPRLTRLAHGAMQAIGTDQG